MRGTLALVLPLAMGGAFVASCAANDEETSLTREQLLDPRTCAKCHGEHYREWSGSMHAYAADDPVFLAMNARFQRESGGQEGAKAFCVNCHAPMAVLEGATTNGLDLAEVPQHLKGVTCYFCHNVEEVAGRHNNPNRLANDTTMRGPFPDAVPNGAHRSAYSSLLAGTRTESAKMCGACHDIETLRGAHIERTFLEWEESVFSKEVDPNDPSSPVGTTCNQCHMPFAGEGPVATGNDRARFRTRHKHTFAGIDVALTPWPEAEAQVAEIKSQLAFETLQSALCVAEVAGANSQINVVLHALTGHSFPSGAVSDRRVWSEVIAYREGAVIYQSGVVPSNGAVAEIPLESDPDLLLLRDCHFDDSGKPTHLFGNAVTFESRLLGANSTFDPRDPAYYLVNRVRRFPYDSGTFIEGFPDRVTLRVLVQPIGLEVLDELIVSGDLAPEIRDRVPTFEVGPTVEWTLPAAESANLQYQDLATRTTFKCVTESNAGPLVYADKTEIRASPTCR